MSKINLETATEEVNKWLDYKKVGDKRRETYKDHVETLVDSIMEGHLILKEDNTFVHTLKIPVEGDLGFDKLEYKPRVRISTIKHHMQGVKSGDSDGRISAYVAALVSKPKALIDMLDTEDYSISCSIAVFFM